MNSPEGKTPPVVGQRDSPRSSADEVPPHPAHNRKEITAFVVEKRAGANALCRKKKTSVS